MKESGKKQAGKGNRRGFAYYLGTESEQFSFFRIPRLLFTERYQSLATEGKLLYGLMLDRMGLSARNGWYDGENRGYIIYTLEEITATLGCSAGKAVKLLAGLEGHGLICRVKQGQGKPTRIYIGRLAQESGPAGPEPVGKDTDGGDIKNEKSRLSKNESLGFVDSKKRKPRLAKNGSLDFQNLHTSHTENIYTENSQSPVCQSNQELKEGEPPDTSPGGPSADAPGQPARTGIAGAQEVTARQIQAQALKAAYPERAGLVDKLVEVMAEVSACRDGAFRMGGFTRPAEEVRAKFAGLGYAEAEYVLEGLACRVQYPADIRSMTAYLRTVLYNAAQEIPARKALKGIQNAGKTYDIDELVANSSFSLVPPDLL